MKYYKVVEDNIITQFARQPNNIIPSFAVEITEEKHKELSEKIKNRPADTLEVVYRLSNETEQYVAVPRTHEETVDWYVQAVSSGTMTIEEVPEDYRAEVEGRIPEPEVDKFKEGYDQAVLDMIESGVL